MADLGNLGSNGNLRSRVRRLAVTQDAHNAREEGPFPEWWRLWLDAHPEESAMLTGMAHAYLIALGRAASDASYDAAIVEERAAVLTTHERSLRQRAYTETHVDALASGEG